MALHVCQPKRNSCPLQSPTHFINPHHQQVGMQIRAQNTAINVKLYMGPPPLPPSMQPGTFRQASFPTTTQQSCDALPTIVVGVWFTLRTSVWHSDHEAFKQMRLAWRGK
eukprot:1161301-Pelagomonas_calceolata.AAC.15